MTMRIAAVTGLSGSGKTTLLVDTITRLVANGERVAAIKHTHHDLNEEDRGDTALLRAAGAAPVVLASDEEAVFFSGDAISRNAYASVDELIGRIDADILLIEGFKSRPRWPVIELNADERRTAADVLAILGRIDLP